MNVPPVVPRFAEAVRAVAGVRAFYAAGSIGSGDYRPGISDLDLVAVLDRPLARRAPLRAVHAAFDEPKLHCVYVPAEHAGEVAREHVTWAHQRLIRRPLSGIARAELHRFGVVLYGPPPAELIPPVTDLAAAARTELAVYWPGAMRDPRRWRTDVHVDLGLTTVARTDATVTEGRLITKREAIDRLPSLGVPADLTDEIRRRRAGETVTLTKEQVAARATLVRELMRHHLDRLLG